MEPSTTVIKAPVEPLVTLFVPFTRKWLIDAFLWNLEAMQLPRTIMEVLFYADTNDAGIITELAAWLSKHGPTFNGATLHVSGNPPPGETDIAERRRRIIAMKEDSKRFIGGSKYVFGLEDDTLPPVDAFTELYPLMRDGVGLASGVEVGRWAIPVIGIWKVDDILNPHRAETAQYQAEGVEEVAATGFYCYMTTTKLYKAATYRAESVWMGPDTAYGLDMRRQGLKVLAHWGVPCGHYSGQSILLPDRESPIAAWDLNGEVWEQQGVRYVLD